MRRKRHDDFERNDETLTFQEHPNMAVLVPFSIRQFRVSTGRARPGIYAG